MSKSIMAASLALAVLGGGAAQAAEPLGAYNVRLDQTTVSGISSGGFMAVQLGVAHSAIIRSVTAHAGGPFWCAEGDGVNGAYNRCMVGQPNTERLIAKTRELAAAGKIDGLEHLKAQRVMVVHGRNDGVVRRPTADALVAYYQAFTEPTAVFFKSDLPAGHAYVTDNAQADACIANGPRFVNDCDYDADAAALRLTAGEALAEPAPGEPTGRLIAFDQKPFIPGNKTPLDISMFKDGHVFVPETCAAGQPCRVHVALHGCKQGADTGINRSGDFPRQIGMNRWAAANNIIVLYPQAADTIANPKGCWDWWGYAGKDYASKDAPQIKAIRAMLERLAAGAKGDAPAAVVTLKSLDKVRVDSTDSSVLISWAPVAGATAYRVTPPGGQPVASPFPSAGLTGLAPASRQMVAIDALAGETVLASDSFAVETTTKPADCRTWFRPLIVHQKEGRAVPSGFSGYKAVGSGQDLGSGQLTEVQLIETKPGWFEKGPCR